MAPGHEKTAQVKEKLARIENYFLDIYSAIMPKKTAASAKTTRILFGKVKILFVA